MSTLREDAQSVIRAALAATQPQHVVGRALAGLRLYGGRLRVLAIGKAAWGMAEAASGGAWRANRSGHYHHKIRALTGRSAALYRHGSRPPGAG